ncbi:MAG: AEC family transporter [Methanobacterium sp.]|nr:AEC family transporter [Methanobacterium sp.]
MSSIETIFTIILLILVGYISKRIGFLKYEDSITLNKIVVNIAIPPLIFLAMYNSDLSNITYLIPITLICIITGSLSGLLVYIFSNAKGYTKKTKWALISASTLFNSGFLGYLLFLEFSELQDW